MTGELGAQMVNAGSREKKRGPGFQRETLWRHSVGAAGYSGRLWTYQTVPGFHLGFMYTLLWELEKGTITPQGAVAEHFIHWTRQSCSRSEAGWFKHPQRLQSQVVIPCVCLVFVLSCLFVSFILSSLQSISFLSTGSLCHFPILQPSLGRSGLCPFLCAAQPYPVFTDILGGQRVLFWCPLSGTAAPHQDRWLSRLFLTVSGEEDSTTYFEIPSTD